MSYCQQYNNYGPHAVYLPRKVITEGKTVLNKKYVTFLMYSFYTEYLA
jgi:hypothetical protein